MRVHYSTLLRFPYFFAHCENKSNRLVRLIDRRLCGTMKTVSMEQGKKYAIDCYVEIVRFHMFIMSDDVYEWMSFRRETYGKKCV